jgi:hypothetical protein
MDQEMGDGFKEVEIRDMDEDEGRMHNEFS